MEKGKVKDVDKVWLSMAEAKAYLDCSRDYLYRLIDESKIKAARDGKMTFIQKESIDRYLTKLMILA